MDALALHEAAYMFSCCELCVKNKRCKQIILVISFVLMTFDVGTDWLNWAEWSKVGGYDQYYFVSIFQKAFLCVAAVGTGLWIIEVFIITKKFINIYREHPEINRSLDRMDFHECLPRPRDISNNFLSKQDDANCNKLKFKDDNEHSTEADVMYYPEDTNYNGSPSEPKITNNKESPSEPENINNKESPSESKVINNKEFPSEPEIINYKEFPSELNSNQFVSETETRHSTESEENEWENKCEGGKGISQLGIVVRILVGIFEDFPAVVVVFFPPTLPMCGVPAKQHVGSGVTLATIISSMLCSLWTMILLFYELCGCSDKGFCCQPNKKCKNNSKLNKGHTTRNSLRQQGYFKKQCMKKGALKTGKIILCIVIFILFSSTFILGLWTVGYVLGFISLKFTLIDPFYLRTAVMTGDFGAGLDAKPDQAMFIYLHYKLPNWHYITLNNNTESASFKYVINRLYIGQFEELSHLKDDTLTKIIPCSTAMPFLQKHAFYGENFQPMNEEEYTDCKIIFTLRYFPSNNNFQPLTNFIHDFHKYITIEYGVHIKNNKTCPKWIHPTSSSSFLSEQVQQDILSYTCNPACGEDTNMCQNVKSWNIDNNPGMNSSNQSVQLWHLSLAINDLITPDTCNFQTQVSSFIQIL